MCVFSTNTALTGTWWCSARSIGELHVVEQPSSPRESSTVCHCTDSVHRRGAVLEHDDVLRTGPRPPRCRARRAAAARSGCPSSPTARRPRPPCRPARRRSASSSIDRRVFAAAVVADLGVGHRPPHRRGRLGHGVGAQIDDPVAVGHARKLLPPTVRPWLSRAGGGRPTCPALLALATQLAKDTSALLSTDSPGPGRA